VVSGQTGARKTKRGSAVSDRQIFHAVKDGRPVQAVLGSGEKIPLAYVLGVDDYHWALIDHDLSVHLVHKSVHRPRHAPLGRGDQAEDGRVP
jgi:hypothetical protein